MTADVQSLALARAASHPPLMKIKAAMRIACQEGRIDAPSLQIISAVIDQVYGLGFCEGVIHACKSWLKEE